MSDRFVIHHGDALDVLPHIDVDPAKTVIITDPVWPNAPAGLFDVPDPNALFAAAAGHFPRLARRAVIVLGCFSDPRFLVGMPLSLPFVRACWMRYARPWYTGTLLAGADVAYVFGSSDAATGHRVLPGEATSTIQHNNEGTPGHPCPRSPQHMSWLVEFFSNKDDTVIDPFAGSSTTGAAAIRLGRHFIGIEQDETFASFSRERLEAEQRGLTIADVRRGQVPLFAEKFGESR